MSDFGINNREYPVLAFSLLPAETVAIDRLNFDTGDWEYAGIEERPQRYVVNLPVSLTLTELNNIGGEYEPAYQGIDYMRNVFSGTETADTRYWHELIVNHDTRVDWINHHSGDLT